MAEQTNTELITEAQKRVRGLTAIAERGGDPWIRVDASAARTSIRLLIEALEAAEAELTRRDAVIATVRAEAEQWRDSPVGEVAPTRGVGELFLGILAAPVSLKAANPSAERVRDFCDGWYSARIHRDIAAATHSPDLVRLGISDEAVKAETTTEWGVRYRNLDDMPVYISHGDEDPRASSEASMVEGDVLVSREVTEWLPVDTEGES